MKTVLVVDDEPDICDMLDLGLRLKGFRVRAALGRDEALRLLQNHTPPDLILMDYCMPGLNARDFVQRVREMGIHAPIVLMTAATEPLKKAHELGLEHVVTKPFNYDGLLTLVGRCTRRSAHASGTAPAVNTATMG